MGSQKLGAKWFFASGGASPMMGVTLLLARETEARECAELRFISASGLFLPLHTLTLPQLLAQGAAACQSHPKARPCCGAGGRKWDRDNAAPQPFLPCRHIPGDGDRLFLPGHGSSMFPGGATNMVLGRVSTWSIPPEYFW